MKKKVNFQRGFSPMREKLEKNVKYNRDCNNCACFYKAKGDHEELCQNDNVLEYDICVEENRTYCSYWKSMSEV